MSEKSRSSEKLKRFWFSDIGFSSILFVTLGNSEQVGVGTEIFVFGCPGNLVEQKLGNKCNFEFSPGYLTSRLPNHPRVYTLRYNAITKGGMSGGPVFDTEGRAVGIHGEGDLDFITDHLGNSVDKLTAKTGFNSAIPINTFRG